MTTDTSERGLERLICMALTGYPCDPASVSCGAPAIPDISGTAGGSGWICGQAYDYDREYCVDLAQLSRFLRDTQPKAAESLSLAEDSPTRQAFLARLQGEISRRGTIDVLRHGVKHGPHTLGLFYGTPSRDNPAAMERHAKNRFSVTRQLRYSLDGTQLSLDLGLFINGLPVATSEPKNKTLEIFGEPYDEGGKTRHRPFHSYTMKQAIQEGFILDVLRHYTPVESYCKLVKKDEPYPEDGKVTVKVLPWRRRLSTVISPPWARAIARARLSPRPVPDSERLRSPR